VQLFIHNNRLVYLKATHSSKTKTVQTVLVYILAKVKRKRLAEQSPTH